jgi:hypothetical protein
VATGFAFDLARLVGATTVHRPDVELRLYTVRGTILPKSRHELVLAALQAGMTHLLFLDSDMRFPKTALVRLLSHREPVVAVNYATRRQPVQPVSFSNDADASERVYTEPGATHLEAVASTGFGCMLIDLDVFRQLPAPWFQMGWVSGGGYLGEDVYFCRKVREAGLRILIDHGLSQEIGHVGEWEYRHDHALATREQLVGAGSHDGNS